MSTTVFYISGHGFGHAARQAPIVTLLGRDADDRIQIRSSVSPEMLRRSIGVPFDLRPVPVDTGIVQATSVAHDDEATVDAALEFYRTFDARIASEVAALSSERVDLVVGDVPPLAFEVAAALGVPGVAIANFTWDWIYETHPGFLPRGADVLERIRAAYRKAALAIELPFSGGFEVFPRVTVVPLVGRKPTRSRADTRTHFGLPARGRVVLLSFGGYGLPSLDLAAVDCRTDWTVVTTDLSSPGAGSLPAHVRLVDTPALSAGGFGYEDLVAASDVVVTKPGYGIIAECIVSDVPVLYTSRGQFREYDVLVAALRRYVRARFIDHDDLFGGRWREALEAVRAQPDPPERMPTDGAERVVALLRDLRRPVHSSTSVIP
ncbi:MAG: hypothetical protein IT184_10170 [Acidobacteria bacterium]|nr:hypothetical protein [Acidobacteriota bacterium]